MMIYKTRVLAESRPPPKRLWFGYGICTWMTSEI